MKRSLLFLSVTMLMFGGTQGQTSLTQAVDFDITFTDGESFNLFEELEAGQYVVVDFFFTTCVPCQINQSSYTGAFQNFGCNMSDVTFISVENTVGDAQTIAYEEDYGGPNSPPAASGTEGGGIAVADAYNIGAFPTFILIAPDGSIVEQDMWPLTDGADTFTSYLGGQGIDIDPDACSLVGIDELEQIANVNVYPNPTSDRVTVDLAAFSSPVTIRVIDVLGKEVSTTFSSALIEEVDLSYLEAGQYILRIFNESAEATTIVSVVD